MLESFILGIIQGITEWLPVSSEGVVATVAIIFWDATPVDAIALSLWLHLGTSLAALIYFRKNIASILVRVAQSPTNFEGDIRFLILATSISILLGVPLLILGNDILTANQTETGLKIFSSAVGVAMVITGLFLLSRKSNAHRAKHQLNFLDSLITGVAQSIAAIPGISRSGMTVSALLARGVDKKEALTLSFLMGIPVTAGAGIYAGIANEFYRSLESFIALGTSLITGLVTIKILLNIADKINFGMFVISVGFLLVVNALLLGPS